MKNWKIFFKGGEFMKEKYVKPTVSENGKDRRFFPAVAAFTAGAMAAKSVRSALGIMEYIDSYVVLETSNNRLAIV